MGIWPCTEWALGNIGPCGGSAVSTEVLSTLLCPLRPVPQLIPPVSRVPPASHAVPSTGAGAVDVERGGALSQAPVGKAQLWFPEEETEERMEAHTSAGSQRSGAQGLAGRGKGRGHADPGGVCTCSASHVQGGVLGASHSAPSQAQMWCLKPLRGLPGAGRDAAQQSSGLAVPRVRLKRTSQGGGQV